MRSVRTLPAFLGVVLALGACAPPEPVTIGMMAGLSGPNSLIGVASRDAARLAVDEINEAGGVNGRPLELRVADDQDDIAVGRRIVAGFVEDGVPVILGPFMSSMAPVVESHRATDVLFLSPTMSTAALLGRDDNFVRVMAASTNQGTALVDEMLRDRVRSAVVVYDSSNAVFSLELARYVQDLMEARQIVPLALLDNQNRDIRDLAGEIAAVAPGALCLVTNGYDSALIAQEVREAGAAPRLYASYWALSEDFVEHGGRAVEGAKLSSILGRKEETDRYLGFEARYMERYGERPDLISSHAYEAVHVLVEALERVDDERPFEIKQAIIEIGRFEGLRDAIFIDEYGDTQRPITLFEVRGGEFVALVR